MKAKTGILAALTVLGAFALWVAVGYWTAAELVYPVENGTGRLVRYVINPIREALARPHLVLENRRLADEVAQLKMRLGDQATTAAENERLRQLLDYRPRLKGDWIAAPVLSHGGPLGAQDLIRVGKGSRAGVREGAPVACPRGLVGRVQRVTPHTAEVRLLSDPRLKVACEVETGDPEAPAVFGILSGGELIHLRRDFTPPPHARILSSGLGEVYPRGLTVGFLANGVHGDETQLEQEGEVTPAVDFAALEDVFIRRED